MKISTVVMIATAICVAVLTVLLNPARADAQVVMQPQTVLVTDCRVDRWGRRFCWQTTRVVLRPVAVRQYGVVGGFQQPPIPQFTMPSEMGGSSCITHENGDGTATLTCGSVAVRCREQPLLQAMANNSLGLDAMRQNCWRP